LRRCRDDDERVCNGMLAGLGILAVMMAQSLPAWRSRQAEE
jgi:hypothetical protein